MNRLIGLLIVPFASVGFSEDYDGVSFPEGVISFADRVVSYEPTFVTSSNLLFANLRDPAQALGVPDYNGLQGADLRGAVSLNTGGRITLEFVDNLLTGSGSNAPDLHIFEVGAVIEEVDVEISGDGVTWHSVGRTGGGISSIDIDSFGFSILDHFRFVRLTDVADQGASIDETAGAEINAVGAISTEPPGILTLGPFTKFKATTLGSVSRTQRLPIKNVGQSTLAGLEIRLAGRHAKDFRATGLGLRTLAPEFSTTCRISFRPRSRGNRRATLLVSANGLSSPSAIVISGLCR